MAACEEPEADATDDERRALEVALGAEAGRGCRGVGPLHMQQVVVGDERDGRAVRDRRDAQDDRERTRADGWGAGDGPRGRPAEMGAGGQRVERPTIGPRLGAPLGVSERPARGRPVERQPRGEAALVLALQLAGEHRLREGEGREAATRGRPMRAAGGAPTASSARLRPGPAVAVVTKGRCEAESPHGFPRRKPSTDVRNRSGSSRNGQCPLAGKTSSRQTGSRAHITRPVFSPV